MIPFKLMIFSTLFLSVISRGTGLSFSNDCGLCLQCKPQVQVTGTIYVPFCGEPRQARLAVLQLLLQHTETIQPA